MFNVDLVLAVLLSVNFVQEKDMAVAGLTITSQRSEVVDFTHPFWYEPQVAAVKVSVSVSVTTIGHSGH